MDASTRNMIKWVISFLVPATLFLIPTNEVYTFEMNDMLCALTKRYLAPHKP